MALEQSGPKHAVGASWRIAIERARLLVSASPLILAAVVAFVVLVEYRAAGAFLVTGAVLVVLSVDELRFAVAQTYWRARWPWDARAAGLVVFGEVGAIPDRKFTSNDNVREVAPSLRSVVASAGARSYVVRPLPGQTLATFETAVDALRVRWKASQVVTELVDRRYVAITVTTGELVDDPIQHPKDRR